MANKYRLIIALICYFITLRIVHIHEVNIWFILYWVQPNQHLPNQNLTDQHLPNLDYAAIESIKRSKQINEKTTTIAVSLYNN